MTEFMLIPDGAGLGLWFQWVFDYFSGLAAGYGMTLSGLFLQAFIFATGLIGQLLVIRKRITGFYFWIAGNIAIIVATIPQQMYGIAMLYMLYNFVTIYGIYEWRREARAKKLSGMLAEA